jgi:hypothetical protein
MSKWQQPSPNRVQWDIFWIITFTSRRKTWIYWRMTDGATSTYQVSHAIEEDTEMAAILDDRKARSTGFLVIQMASYKVC